MSLYRTGGGGKDLTWTTFAYDVSSRTTFTFPSDGIAIVTEGVDENPVAESKFTGTTTATVLCTALSTKRLSDATGYSLYTCVLKVKKGDTYKSVSNYHKTSVIIGA